MQDLRPNTELKKQTVKQLYNRNVDTTKGTLTEKNTDSVPSKDAKEFAKEFAAILREREKSRIFDDEDPTTLTPRGQEVMDYVTARTGGQSTVKRLTRDNPQFNPDIGGFVRFDDPSTVYVNPEQERQDYILAHELAHSQAKTPISEKQIRNVLQYGNPFDRGELPVDQGLDRFAGSTFRHAFESTTAPTMIEEANAQGVAQGVMRGLGRSTKDPFYRDPRDYPFSEGMKGLNTVNTTHGTFVDQETDPYTGQDLGAVDAYGNRVYPQMSVPASIHNPEVGATMDRIIKNMPLRINRQYQQGIRSMK